MCILKPASHPRSESCPVFSSALLSRAWLWGTRTRSVLPRSGGQPFQCWLLQCNRKKVAWNESARAPAGRAPARLAPHASRLAFQRGALRLAFRRLVLGRRAQPWTNMARPQISGCHGCAPTSGCASLCALRFPLRSASRLAPRVPDLGHGSGVPVAGPGASRRSVGRRPHPTPRWGALPGASRLTSAPLRGAHPGTQVRAARPRFVLPSTSDGGSTATRRITCHLSPVT